MISRLRLKPPFWFLCILILVEPTFSQVNPKIAVLPLPGEVGSKASLAIAEEFKKNQNVTLIDQAQVQSYLRSQGGVGKSSSTIAQAEEKLTKGQELYGKLKIKEAIDELQEAKILFRQNLKAEESFKGLRSTQFFLSMAFLANQQEERAKDELRQVYIMDPERNTRKLSDKLYPPTIRNLFEDVKKEFSDKPLGELEVVTFPPGALAYVDGKSVGETPAIVKNLPVGEHVIYIVIDDKTDIAGTKFVISGPNRYEPDLNVALSQNVYQYFQTTDPLVSLDHHRVSYLDTMGVTLGSEVFVFLSPGNQEVVGQLYDQRSQTLSSKVSESTPELLVKKLLMLIDSSGYVVAAPKPSLENNSPDLTVQPAESSTLADDLKKEARQSRYHGDSWTSRHKTWLMAGGGAVVLGAAVYFGLKLLSSDSNNTVLKIKIP